MAGAFLAPFLYGLYWKRTTAASVWTCILFSSAVMIANIFFGQYFPSLIRSPINCGVACMLAGLIIVPIVSLLPPAPKKDKVDEIFACYDRKVVVTATDAIDEM